MELRRLFLFAVLSLAVVRGAAAQQSPEVQVDLGTHHFSIGDLLHMHNIDLTAPSLVAALRNTDPEVRWLAAVQLQEDKVVEAIPAIYQALESEKAPRARVNMALALALLGDTEGRDEMHRLCADETFPPEFRLYAVRYMFDLHVSKDESCLRTAEQIANLVSPDYHTIAHRISALELLPRFHDLTPEESDKVFRIVARRLKDPEPTVRMQAGRSLTVIGNPAAITDLQRAIAREDEEGTRNVLEQELEKLQAGSARPPHVKKCACEWTSRSFSSGIHPLTSVAPGLLVRRALAPACPAHLPRAS